MGISNHTRRHTGNISPEYALLGFLVPGPDHGYNLHQTVLHELGHVWHLSQSQAYTILKRLEIKGDISARVVEQSKLPDRQLLRLTAQGRRRFTEWLEQGSADNARAIRLELLTRLYFSQLYKPEDTAAIFAAQSVAVGRNIERLEGVLARLADGQPCNRLSLDLRIRQLRVIRTWMAEIRAEFHSSSEVTQ